MEKGSSIIGDIPIYVALDSADTWSHPELFQLSEGCVPKALQGFRRMPFLPPVSCGQSSL